MIYNQFFSPGFGIGYVLSAVPSPSESEPKRTQRSRLTRLVMIRLLLRQWTEHRHQHWPLLKSHARHCSASRLQPHISSRKQPCMACNSRTEEAGRETPGCRTLTGISMQQQLIFRELMVKATNRLQTAGKMSIHFALFYLVQLLPCGSQ